MLTYPITQFRLGSKKPVVPKGSTFYTYLNIRVAKCVEIIYIMYVTMILPLHFSVPIYSPWKKKQKKNNSHKIKRGAGPLPGPEYIPYHFEWLYIQSWQKNRKNRKKIEKI